MRFDLIDLKLFLNVVEAGSITAGAERMHLAVAAASTRIRNMEIELGTPLLNRERQGVHPTPAGMTLVHHARLILQQTDRMRGELGEYADGLKGHIRLMSMKIGSTGRMSLRCKCTARKNGHRVILISATL